MKKLLIIFALLLFLPSITAASYTQTAADVSPGVFADGEYYFSNEANVVIGTDSDPGLSSPASLYITEGSNDIPVYITTGNSYSLYSKNTGIGTALFGYSEEGRGIYGKSDATSSSYAAVYGYATGGAPAVYGYDSSGSGIGVKAYSTNYGFYTSGADYGLYIPSADTYGVYVAASDHYGAKFVGDVGGVYGDGDYYGVYGNSDVIGVRGDGETYGVEGTSDATGVYGYSRSTSSLECGVKGYNFGSGNTGYIGCYNYGIYTPDDAKVDGTLRVGSCSGCDIAEHFIGDNLEPGDVVVLDPTSANHVRKTTTPYDKLAAGIISTDPTITMGLSEGVPVALSGVVPTKVIGTVHLGDLLTTSSTPGYAMACADYNKCAGAIIGKAMEENSGGEGVITALVMLG
ncbi:hypothetical protein HZC31_01660 [Candidatus Woesearchaeota archaeon]|nr:hypothetical protein [Candidatus Woesearchaeota archaeon]